MLIIFFKTHQRTTTLNVSLDNQLKIDSFYLSQNPFVIIISQFYKTLVSHHCIFMRSDVKETDYSTFLSHNHDGMDGGESNIDYSTSHHQNSFKLQFLYIPYIDSPIITTRSQNAIPSRCLSTCQFVVRLPDIPYKLKLTLRISLVYEYPSI